MSNDLICRTKTFNDTHPCFLDERNECRAITIEECGLDLEGIPENEQTKGLFEAARKTDLATILSEADAMKVAKERVSYPGGADFGPAMSVYDRIYENSLRRYANRFYEDAKRLIQKMKGGQLSK